MRPITHKVPHLYKRILYSCLCLSWCSGLLFFALNSWGQVEGDFGPEKHPWQFPALQVHGAMAFLLLLLLGALVINHALPGLQARRHLQSGLSLLLLIAGQVISGYLLYYLASPDYRNWVAWMHLWLGASFPAAVFAHVKPEIWQVAWLKRNQRSQQNHWGQRSN